MADPSSIRLEPNFRTFLLWCMLLLGMAVGFCALYHVYWPFSHPVPREELSEYIADSLAICFGLFLVLLVLYVLPATIIFTLQRTTYWEAWSDGVAIYRKGRLVLEVPWEEYDRIVARPMGLRLHLRTRARPETLRFIPWGRVPSFARYCNERVAIWQSLAQREHD